MLYTETITFVPLLRKVHGSSTVYAQVTGTFVQADDEYVNSCAVKCKLHRSVF